MKKMLGYFLLISILLVVAAGCTSNNQQATPSSSDGLVIRKFEPADSSIDAGSNVVLTYEIANVGDKTANNVTLKLIAPDDFTGEKDQYIGDMLPPGRQSHVEGDFRAGSFVLKSPSDVPQNSQITAPFSLRAYYGYSSSAHTEPITIYSRDEYRRLQGKGEAVGQQTVTVVNNNGPIQFEVPYPVNPYFDPANGRTSFQLLVNVKNAGQGTPIYNGEDNMILGRVWSSTGTIKCEQNGEFTEPGRYSDMVLHLNRAGTGTFMCEIMVDPSEVQEQNLFTIYFNFNYTYYVTATTSVTVNGPEY